MSQIAEKKFLCVMLLDGLSVNLNHLKMALWWAEVVYVKEDVKILKRCQNVNKMSKRCQMSKSQTHRLWSRFTKKINLHNEVHTYWRQFWHQIWRSPKLFKNTFYAHFEGFWSPSYVTSKLMSICVNLIMWTIFLWTSSIVYVFDFLTSFWQLDIFLTAWHFLTVWHLFDNLTVFLTYGQQDTWAMGHMGKGVSWLILKIEMGYLGGWGTWAIGHMIITSLILHGSLQKFYCT